MSIRSEAVKEHAPIYATIGAVFRDKREQLGISQRTMAKHLGIHQASILRIEHGLHYINVVQFFQFCKLLDLDVEEMCKIVQESDILKGTYG